jgi:hypothetical protein
LSHGIRVSVENRLSVTGDTRYCIALKRRGDRPRLNSAPVVQIVPIYGNLNTETQHSILATESAFTYANFA